MFFLYIKDGDSVFDRVEKFIGANNLSLIKSKVVMIVGLGGVGSFSVEALVRSGIENIIIVDYDTIDITNLNRQVMTNVSNIGKLKVDEVEARVLSINPKCSVVKLCLELNLDTKTVSVDNRQIKVTPIEFKILQLLMEYPGKVFSAENIYESVWKEDAINTDTVMVHVRNLREKIELDPKHPQYLKVVWGVGYKIEKQGRDSQ